ncbi:hypothetical protein CFC21_110683 [Triticum aestivum]|uniref:Uncharacterized protein n=2 Tax=Triticum aestivum TaxID=4565 RepID=A0A9R1MNE6_WHEAT|nr:uncharacterized protein At2g39910-like [Triticum aestivum]KAF7110596.1 hypothetical protein CFC21_110683 [Triticum aestivum]
MSDELDPKSVAPPSQLGSHTDLFAEPSARRLGGPPPRPARTSSTPPYAPPEGSDTSVKSLLASLLLPPSEPPTSGAGTGKEAVDLLLFCAAARAASAEAPALHWVPEGLSKAAAAAMEEMAATGGWTGIGEMLVAMMPETVPPLKAVLKDTGVDANDDMMMIGAVKPPKEHAFVAAHQFRWLLSQVCAHDSYTSVLMML